MKYDFVKFELTHSQIERLNNWLVEVEERAANIQIENSEKSGRKLPTKNLPYYGAIGGGLSFTFAGTGLGIVCKVTETITGETIDLSDYDAW